MGSGVTELLIVGGVSLVASTAVAMGTYLVVWLRCRSDGAPGRRR